MSRFHFGRTVLLSALVCLIVVQCSKTTGDAPAKEDPPKENVVKQVDYLPGPCPYDCHDTRCKGYYQGYCGTDDPPPTNPPGAVTVRTNPDNPYDYVGSYHNEGLSNVLSAVNSSSPTLGNDILQATRSWLSGRSFDVAAFDAAYSQQVSSGDFGIPDPWLNNEAAYFDYMYSNGQLSATAKSYLVSLNNTIDLMVADDAVPSQLLYNKLCIKIVLAENNAAADPALSGVEKAMIQNYGAVMRYSAQYWAATFMPGTARVATASGARAMVLPPTTNRFSWKRFFKADAMGALHAAIHGVLLGHIGVVEIVGEALIDSAVDALFNERV